MISDTTNFVLIEHKQSALQVTALISLYVVCTDFTFRSHQYEKKKGCDDLQKVTHDNKHGGSYVGQVS